MAEYIYGKLISTGKIISILDIPTDIRMRGPWACICPQCGAPLVARKGPKREPHFAHKGDTTPGCNSLIANKKSLAHMVGSALRDLPLSCPPHYISPEKAGITGIPAHIRIRLAGYRCTSRPSVIRGTEIIEIGANRFIVKDGQNRVVVVLSFDSGEDVDISSIDPKYDILCLDLSNFIDNPINTFELTDLILDESIHKRWLHQVFDSEELKAAQDFYNNDDTIRDYRKWLEVEREKALEQRRILEEQRKEELAEQQAGIAAREKWLQSRREANSADFTGWDNARILQATLKELKEYFGELKIERITAYQNKQPQKCAKIEDEMQKVSEEIKKRESGSH